MYFFQAASLLPEKTALYCFTFVSLYIEII